MKKITLLFVANLLFLAGCTRYVDHNREDKYTPFPDTEIIINTQYAYDKNHIGEIKNPSCTFTLKTTSDIPVQIELWRHDRRTGLFYVMYDDYKVKEIKHDKANNTTLQLDKYIGWQNSCSPFCRIECYSSIDGQIQSKTIHYNFILPETK